MKRRIKGIYLILAIILFSNFSILTFANSIDYFQGKIYFPYGKSIIKNHFRENNKEILLIDSVCSSLNNHGQYKIKIIGSASPEGELSFNEILSCERAQALKNQIVAKYHFSDSTFIIESLGANKESVELSRNLRYAEIVINLLEQSKNDHAIIRNPIKVNAEKERITENSFDKKMNVIFPYLLVLFFFLLVVFAFTKKRCIIEKILNKYGKEGDGSGNTPTTGSFTGKIGESLYQMDEIPQNRGTNNERKNRDELLSNPFYFKNPQKDNLLPAKAKKELCDLQRKLSKANYKGIIYKNRRPIFAPFSITVFTKITSSRNDNMKRGVKQLSKRWECTEEEAQNVLTSYDLVLHERVVKIFGIRIGEIQFLPKNIHENAPHSGGVSDAKKMV